MNSEKGFKSGFVAVVGRPNVGKSTLINALIDDKIVIVSDKAQTTRNRIVCVYTDEKKQIVFMDTPGIHKPKHKLGEFMVDQAVDSLREVEAVLFVVAANEKRGPGDNFVIEQLRKVNVPVFLIVNKIDTMEKQDSDIVREKILLQTHDEIPHAIAVDVDEMKTRDDGTTYIRATIYVERDSQKGIIIGKQGSMLKLIGKQARADIERLLATKVFLDVWVKVKKDWRNKSGMLSELGYRN